MKSFNTETDHHLECVSDFCGNHKSPGAWADKFARADGTEYVALGGGWVFYGVNTPEFIDSEDPHYAPFLESCADGTDFAYARQHWN